MAEVHTAHKMGGIDGLATEAAKAAAEGAEREVPVVTHEVKKLCNFHNQTVFLVFLKFAI